MSKEDAACNQLVELALNDLAYAGGVLREAVGGCPWASELLHDRDIWRVFQASLRNSLEVWGHTPHLSHLRSECLCYLQSGAKGSNHDGHCSQVVYWNLRKHVEDFAHSAFFSEPVCLQAAYRIPCAGHACKTCLPELHY